MIERLNLDFSRNENKFTSVLCISFLYTLAFSSVHVLHGKTEKSDGKIPPAFFIYLGINLRNVKKSVDKIIPHPFIRNNNAAKVYILSYSELKENIRNNR